MDTNEYCFSCYRLARELEKTPVDELSGAAVRWYTQVMRGACDPGTCGIRKDAESHPNNFSTQSVNPDVSDSLVREVLSEKGIYVERLPSDIVQLMNACPESRIHRSASPSSSGF